MQRAEGGCWAGWGVWSRRRAHELQTSGSETRGPGDGDATHSPAAEATRAAERLCRSLRASLHRKGEMRQPRVAGGDQWTVESGPCTHGWRTPAAIRTCVSRRGDRTGFVLVGLTVLALRRPVWRPLPHGPGLRLTQRPPPKGQEGPWDPRGLRGDLPVLPRATWGVLPRVQHLGARHRPGQALA